MSQEIELPLFFFIEHLLHTHRYCSLLFYNKAYKHTYVCTIRKVTSKPCFKTDQIYSTYLYFIQKKTKATSKIT